MTEGRAKYYDPDRESDQRRTPGRRKSWVASEIQEQHHEIIRLLVLGFSNVKIAELLGVTPQTVSNVKNSPIVQDRVRELQSSRDVKAMNIRAEVEQAAPEAFLLLQDVIRGEVNGERVAIPLRVRTAENMLDRTVPKKTQHEHAHAHFTPEQIRDFRDRAERNMREERERKSA